MTSQANNIEQAKLHLVDRFGNNQTSLPLDKCDGALVSEQISFPSGSFTYHLVGKDSYGVDFSYDTGVEAEFRNHTTSLNVTSDLPLVQDTSAWLLLYDS